VQSTRASTAEQLAGGREIVDPIADPLAGITMGTQRRSPHARSHPHASLPTNTVTAFMRLVRQADHGVKTCPDIVCCTSDTHDKSRRLQIAPYRSKAIVRMAVPSLFASDVSSEGQRST
jgi:hypothetical protein